MINNIQIKSFKCIENEDLDFGLLNIITGLNSAGKSSIIQAIQLFEQALNCEEETLRYYSFNVIRNRYLNAKEVQISLNGKKCSFVEKEFNFPDKSGISLKKNKNIFFLKEDRIGPRDSHANIESDDIGDDGEFILSLLYKHQSSPISQELVLAESETLAQNVDFWLEKIFDKHIELKVQKNTNPKELGATFTFDELDGILPTQLGAGLSYAASVVIVCLRAKPGDVVVIQNPEIHLHPAAQSKMGEFLAFIASKGIQIIAETHCEHLINRIRYEVYSKQINSEDVKVFYKSDVQDPFIKIGLSSKGQYECNGNPVKFPSGFFDATLEQLLEIG